MGAGGMARVYLAVHREIPNLRVVLKVLTDPQLADRFKQEADKLALLDGHPNVCRIRHFFDHGDDLVIAMDFIDGPTVETKVKKSGPLPYEEAISIISQVLDVLEIAHSRGISHRDIKPSNIMIDTHGRVQVIDFGIAKGEADPSMTAAHGYAGTPDYMAPEQFGSSAGTNHNLADIYAVGITLYEMLCGALPFPGGDVFTIRDAKLFKEPTNPRQYRPDMSKHLEQVIMKAMSRQPEDRFQSAREMKEFLLAGSARDESRKTPPPASAKPVKPVKVKKPRSGKSPIPRLVGVFVILAALAAAGYYGWPYLQQRLAASSEVLPDEPRPVPPGPSARVALHPAELRGPDDAMVLDAGSSPTLVWTSVPDAAAYEVEVAIDRSFADLQVKEKVSDTTAVLGALAAGDYYWRVTAVAADATAGPISSVRTFTVTAGEEPSETPAAQAPGRLIVTVDRPSTISINGDVRERNAASSELSLAPGRYTIRVDNPNTREKSKTERVEVKSDQIVSQAFTFSDLSTGSITISSNPPGAQIVVDGDIQRGVTTPHVLTLTEGSHTISVVSAERGNRTMVETVTLKPQGNPDLHFDFTEAEQQLLARRLADSIRVVKESLDEAARGSTDFAAAQKTEYTGNQNYADGDYDGAVASYRTALAGFAQSRSNTGLEKTALEAVIEQLRAAYQATDMNALKKVYPGIPKDEEKGWKQFFSSARDLEVTMGTEAMDVKAGAADATISVRMKFFDSTGKRDQTFRWQVQFEKTGGNWIVAKRQTL